jgi:hypothetical protein
MCVVCGAKVTTGTLAELRKSITSPVSSVDLDNYPSMYGVLLFGSPLDMDSCDVRYECPFDVFRKGFAVDVRFLNFLQNQMLPKLSLMSLFLSASPRSSDSCDVT